MTAAHFGGDVAGRASAVIVQYGGPADHNTGDRRGASSQIAQQGDVRHATGGKADKAAVALQHAAYNIGVPKGHRQTQ